MLTAERLAVLYVLKGDQSLRRATHHKKTDIDHAHKTDGIKIAGRYVRRSTQHLQSSQRLP